MVTIPKASEHADDIGAPDLIVVKDRTLLKRVLSKSVLGLISLFMLIPILIVLLSWTQPMADIWPHMGEYVLPQVLKNTAILLAMVTVISGSVGTSLAWVTSMYRFPGQRFFSWALMLPLAIPAYVFAFVTVGMVDFSGPLQTSLRELGVTTAIPSVRNVWGAGFILSLAFYPYVYLLARQAFLSQGFFPSFITFLVCAILGHRQGFTMERSVSEQVGKHVGLVEA